MRGSNKLYTLLFFSSLPLRGFSLFNPLKVHFSSLSSIVCCSSPSVMEFCGLGNIHHVKFNETFSLVLYPYIERGEKSNCVFGTRTQDAVGSSWKGQTTAWGQYLWEICFLSLYSPASRLDWHVVPPLEANAGLESNTWQCGNKAFGHCCYSERIFSYPLLSFLRRNGICSYSTLSAPTRMHTFVH